jgi:hypothetical protein
VGRCDEKDAGFVSPDKFRQHVREGAGLVVVQGWIFDNRTAIRAVMNQLLSALLGSCSRRHCHDLLTEVIGKGASTAEQFKRRSVKDPIVSFSEHHDIAKVAEIGRLADRHPSG